MMENLKNCFMCRCAARKEEKAEQTFWPISEEQDKLRIIFLLANIFELPLERVSGLSDDDLSRVFLCGECKAKVTALQTLHSVVSDLAQRFRKEKLSMIDLWKEQSKAIGSEKSEEVLVGLNDETKALWRLINEHEFTDASDPYLVITTPDDIPSNAIRDKSPDKPEFLQIATESKAEEKVEDSTKMDCSHTGGSDQVASNHHGQGENKDNKSKPDQESDSPNQSFAVTQQHDSEIVPTDKTPTSPKAVAPTEILDCNSSNEINDNRFHSEKSEAEDRTDTGDNIPVLDEKKSTNEPCNFGFDTLALAQVVQTPASTIISGNVALPQIQNSSEIIPQSVMKRTVDRNDNDKEPVCSSTLSCSVSRSEDQTIHSTIDDTKARGLRGNQFGSNVAVARRGNIYNPVWVSASSTELPSTSQNIMRNEMRYFSSRAISEYAESTATALEDGEIMDSDEQISVKSEAISQSSGSSKISNILVSIPLQILTPEGANQKDIEINPNNVRSVQLSGHIPKRSVVQSNSASARHKPRQPAKRKSPDGKGHNSVKQFKCGNCGMAHDTALDFQHHALTGCDKFCLVCKKECRSKSAVQQHVNDTHTNRPRSTNSGRPKPRPVEGGIRARLGNPNPPKNRRSRRSQRGGNRRRDLPVETKIDSSYIETNPLSSACSVYFVK